MKIGKNIYYLVSIISGGCLMAMEVLITKLIGPYFGASLYVWAATIGTTLLGLALGYYYAGILCEKDQVKRKLMLISIISAIYLIILPYFSGMVMDLLIDLEVTVGIIVSTLIFNFPLFFLFGLFSPMIIQILSSSIEDAGVYAGRIYGLSTLSGVVFILFVGIYTLPEIGTKISVFMCSALFILASMAQFLHLKNAK